MKILVCGGAGYIGSHVCLELQTQGHQVTVFDNFSTGLKSNLHQGQSFIQGDLLHLEDLEQAFCQDFDAVIHLAAYKAAGESMIEPEKYSCNNITGTLNLLQIMNRHRCQKLVFSSTAAVYGEPQYLPIDEDHPTHPENFYGFTKLEIERFLVWYTRLRGLHFASLRYFNAAGYDLQSRILSMEQNPANLLPVVMETACGIRPQMTIYGHDYPTKDGSCIRDYIHVSDLAQAHVLALDKLSCIEDNLIVNLGTGQGVSVLEMVDVARAITGKPIPALIGERRPGDPACIIASYEKAKQILGWEPQCSDVKSLIESSWKVYQHFLINRK